jgi:hypothetical protein
LQSTAECAILYQVLHPAPSRRARMSKLYQVRYTVGDKTVAHEHYTEKGAKMDAKSLSKAVGNAVIGEIEINDESHEQSLVRVWEFAGGESGKPVKKDGAPPSAVEILKTADETRLQETVKEKKPKSPKLTDEEKIQKIADDARAKLEQIEAGTYVLPARGRKAATDETGEPKKKKAEVNKVDKIVETLGCSEHAAEVLNEIGTTAVSRRAKVAAFIIDGNGPVAASAIVEKLNADPDESDITIKKVVSAANFDNYLFSKHEQPWRFTIKAKGEDTIFNFVPVKIEYQGGAEDEPTDEQQAAAE